MRIRAAGVTVALAAGLVGATGPAATAAAATTAKLDYACGFGTSNTTVGVTITATFPDRVTADKPFQPAGVQTALSIPRAALTALGNATSVSATTQLTVKVGQGTQSADAGWFGTAPATTVPASGALDLAATGDVPTVTVHGAEPVTFTASGLDLTLTPGGADRPLPATCNPARGQHTLLARLPIRDGGAAHTVSPTATRTPSPNSSSPGSTEGSSQPPVTPGLATPGVQSTPVTPHDVTTDIDPAVYKECRDYDFPIMNPGSAYAAGLANVRKLNAATEVGFPEAALLRSTSGEGYDTLNTPDPFSNGELYACSIFTSQLDYHGRREFPATAATSSAFGFVPVTATAHLNQVGDSPITAVAWQAAGQPHNTQTALWPYRVAATASVSLRLSDVHVNGVPLDVGPRCRTSRPLYTPDHGFDPNNDQVVTTGGTMVTDTAPMFGTITGGGGTEGDVTIPPFTGCSTPNGDNLNKLLTASISGPGNHTKITAARLCIPSALVTCNDVEKRIPSTNPTWTLTHGGHFSQPISRTSPFAAVISPTGLPNTIITCASTRASGIAYNHVGPARGNLGSVTYTGTDGCTDNKGATWNIDEQLPISFYPAVVSPTGDINMRGTGQFKLTRTSGGKSCSITASGVVGLVYNNDTGTFHMFSPLLVNAGAMMSLTATTCPDEFPISEDNPDGDSGRYTKVFTQGGQFTLPQDQAFTLTNPQGTTE